MTPTVPYVEEKIMEFNDLIFDSCLPPIEVKLSHARTFLGKVQYRRTRSLFGGNRNTDFQMRISTMFDLPEEEQEDVIIHELIHYYIAWKGLRDSSTHGRIFRGQMERINRDFGRHITVSHRTPAGAVCQKTQVERAHCVCVSLLKDGGWGVTVCSSAMMPKLNRLLPRHFAIRQMQWCESTDPFFNRFPHSRSPKIYKVTKSDLSAALREALPELLQIPME